MRTLIIAAVAMAAFAAKADGIVSSSVVGYQNLDTESVGNVLITPTFLNVGETNKCYLSDLKVTGYSAPTPGKKSGTWNGGCGGGKFVVTLLTANGTSAGDYYWIDNGKLAAGWYQTAEGAAIEGGAAAVELSVGKSLWISGSGYTLVPAGVVNTEDVAFPTETIGNVAVGNFSPVDLTLADLTVEGYSAPTPGKKTGTWNGGCGGGKFVVTKLTANGTSAGDYYWIDNGKLPAGWYQTAEGAAIEGGAEAVAIPAGQGLWTSGSGYLLNIPAPDLNGEDKGVEE